MKESRGNDEHEEDRKREKMRKEER